MQALCVWKCFQDAGWGAVEASGEAHFSSSSSPPSSDLLIGARELSFPLSAALPVVSLSARPHPRPSQLREGDSRLPPPLGAGVYHPATPPSICVGALIACCSARRAWHGALLTFN